MLILLFTFAACSDVSFNPENDADLSLASSSESLFDFIEVNEDHVGIMGLGSENDAGGDNRKLKSG